MSYRIMIVDDEPDILLFMSTVLEDNGYVTCSLRDEEDVTEALLTQKPDLLVLDYMMPKRSGIAICKEIRDNSKFNNIAIIMISAMISSNSLEKKEFIKKFSDFDIPLPECLMEKPVVVDELLKNIKMLLEKRN